MAEVVITDSAKTDKMEMKAKKLFKSSDFCIQEWIMKPFKKMK